MKLYINPYPSEYESKYVIWVGLDYDKKKLIKFINYYDKINRIPKKTKYDKQELFILNDILSEYDISYLEKLLNNDTNVSRLAIIEKLSRDAALEKLLKGVYSKTTYTKISNLPVSDYQLVMKRIDEIVTMVNSITHQTEEYPKHLPST